jgi:hypothetical protein
MLAIGFPRSYPRKPIGFSPFECPLLIGIRSAGSPLTHTHTHAHTHAQVAPAPTAIAVAERKTSSIEPIAPLPARLRKASSGGGSSRCSSSGGGGGPQIAAVRGWAAGVER